MYARIAILAVALTVAYAQHQGHAYSSQHVVHHEVHHAAPAKHQEYQKAPVVAHHFAPFAPQPTSAAHRFTPAAHYSAPAAHHSAPATHHAAPAKHEEEQEHYGHPKYEFSYYVEDKHTGDIKSQKESRDGHVVKGEYSLHQPDGIVRTVKYSADKHTGFNADVHYSGQSKHVQLEHH